MKYFVEEILPSVLMFIAAVVILLVLANVFSSDAARQKERFSECVTKTSDINWCYNLNN